MKKIAVTQCVARMLIAATVAWSLCVKNAAAAGMGLDCMSIRVHMFLVFIYLFILFIVFIRPLPIEHAHTQKQDRQLKTEKAISLQATTVP